MNKKIIGISCGETHTLCLTESGHLYSFGGNTCGQLGQFMNESDKKKKNKIEDITFPKITNSLESNQYSFMSSTDSPPGSPKDK